MKSNMITKYKKDFIIMAIILALSAIIGICIFLLPQSGKYAEVLVDGNSVYITPLTSNQTYTIEGISGQNYLVIENGEAFLSDATCPDKLCVNMGKISKSGQSIICLPNKVIVRIIDKAEDAVDSVAY